MQEFLPWGASWWTLAVKGALLCLCRNRDMVTCGFGLGGMAVFLYFHFAAYLIAK